MLGKYLAFGFAVRLLGTVAQLAFTSIKFAV